MKRDKFNINYINLKCINIMVLIVINLVGTLTFFIHIDSLARGDASGAA